jgi:hypothetical protein
LLCCCEPDYQILARITLSLWFASQETVCTRCSTRKLR